MNIIFMGTPDFAKESLQAIYEAGHNVIAVVTNPDKPKGRGMKMVQSPVKEYAISKNIEVFQLKSRYNLCCSLWKNFTKRIIGNSKTRMHKCTWFTSSKI